MPPVALLESASTRVKNLKRVDALAVRKAVGKESA